MQHFVSRITVTYLRTLYTLFIKNVSAVMKIPKAAKFGVHVRFMGRETIIVGEIPNYRRSPLCPLPRLTKSN